MYIKNLLLTFFVPVVVLSRVGLAVADEKMICRENSIPTGATEVGASQLLFQDCPQLDDLDFTDTADGKKYYSGLWIRKKKERSLYGRAENGIVIKKLGSIATVKPNSTAGRFPLLSGKRAFYIEAQVSTSLNDLDNFPAVWLMPIEHNLRMEDVYAPDPQGFERWFELDIDEGGFGVGGHHTAISWVGRWPNYKKIQNPNPTSKVPLDRTKPNIFGVSYNPDDLKVTWWLNGKKVLEASQPYVPEIARSQNFYLIVSAQTHRNISDYQLIFHGVRAYVGGPY